MPREEEDVLAYIAKVIGGKPSIPPGHTAVVHALQGEEFGKLAEAHAEWGHPKPFAAFSVEGTITNKQTGETRQCLVIGVDRSSLHQDERIRRVQLVAYIAHEGVESRYITPPTDIQAKAAVLREVTLEHLPQLAPYFTPGHLEGIFALTRFAIQEGGLGTALAIHREVYGVGGKNRDEDKLADRVASISVLNIESGRDRIVLLK